MAGKARGADLTGKPILQPDAFVTDEQDYSTKGVAVFVGDRASYANRPQRGDVHPLDANCLLYSCRSTATKLQKIRYDCEYMGLSANPTPYFLEFVGSIGEEPIETHKNFVSIIGGTPDAPLHSAYFDPDSGAFVGFPVTDDSDFSDASQSLAGVRTYYRPSVVVRVSYWTLQLPNPAALGHIIESGTIVGLVLPADCLDLLCTNFGYRQITPGYPPYQITVEYLASGPNGWNTLIYSEN